MNEYDVPQMIESLVKKFSYKPLSPQLSQIMRKFYIENLPLPPEFKDLKGRRIVLLSSCGTVLLQEYDRIVVGDYGAFIEFTRPASPLIVEKGQSYRQQPRYKNNVKYDWLTLQDDSHIKVYHQKRTVKYADYLVGKYYVSPYQIKIVDTTI